MKITCKLYDVDDVLADLYDSDAFAGCDYEVLEEVPKESLICVSTVRVIVPSLGLEMRDGYYANWEEETNSYMADFSLTAIYEIGADAKDYLVWEQDGYSCTLWNATQISAEEFETLECIITDEREARP